jgi:SAM-dependent methyltransferase
MKAVSTRSHWRRHWGREESQQSAAHPELVAAVTRSLDKILGNYLLEVGAGMGGDSIELAHAGAKVVAMDYEESALVAMQRFAQQARVGVKLLAGDALALPFADETFDCVFHQGLLEHFEASQQLILLRENYRVLKPGGTLVVDVPQKYSDYTLYKRRMIRRGEWFAGWETEFSPPELARAVRGAGFEVQGLYPRHILEDVRARIPGRVWRLFQRSFLWRWLERSRLALYFCWSIGAVARKPLAMRRSP